MPRHFHTDSRPGPSRPGETIPLASASTGQEVVLVRMAGGHEFQHRMAEMGLLPGVRFRVISHARYGPIIVSVKDTRLMLGRGMAQRVLVRPD